MNMRKLGTLVIALIMVMTCTVAFADPTTVGTNTYSGSGVSPTVGTNTIPLSKTIVLFNTDGSVIREPNISFNYTVGPVTVTEGDVTITDSNNVINTVNSGVAGAFTGTLTLTFASTNTVAAAQGGTEVMKTGNLEIDTTVFQHAGIYRYLITETPSVVVTTVGLDDRTGDYKTTRYLDVYIKNGATAGTYELSAAVIFQSATGDSDDINTQTTKTTGFEPSNTSNYESDNTVDKYHTFNLEVNKTITGNLADKTHDFPFEITLTGNKAATIVADYANGNATFDGTAPTTIDVNTTAVVLKPKMSDGDSVTITGIPVGTTVQVMETNDTYDKYTPSLTTQTGFTGLTLTETGALTAQTGTTQLTAAAGITSKDANSVIGLTNNLAEISPTGVVLRFAPYALMLAAGIVLLVIGMKRRAKED